jgi:hypothetical protein
MLPTISHTQRTRSLTHLTPKLDKVLLGYAAAAGAAGVGLLALAQTAEARIVYTPSNVPIPLNGGSVPLDLNQDGIADFSFINVSGTCEHPKHVRRQLGCAFAYMSVIAAQSGNQIGASQTFNGPHCAAELGKGRRVGPGKNFRPYGLPMFVLAGSSGSYTLDCPWPSHKFGFLGLAFVVGGQTYYGWARITWNPRAITGYAYETVPNQSILTGATHGADEQADASQPHVLPAPQPASLGLLAHGASGLSIWRRPEEINPQPDFCSDFPDPLQGE